jgi:hypothetical protein
MLVFGSQCGDATCLQNYKLRRAQCHAPGVTRSARGLHPDTRSTTCTHSERGAARNQTGVIHQACTTSASARSSSSCVRASAAFCAGNDVPVAQNLDRRAGDGACGRACQAAQCVVALQHHIMWHVVLPGLEQLADDGHLDNVPSVSHKDELLLLSLGAATCKIAARDPRHQTVGHAARIRAIGNRQSPDQAIGVSHQADFLLARPERGDQPLAGGKA